MTKSEITKKLLKDQMCKTCKYYICNDEKEACARKRVISYAPFIELPKERICSKWKKNLKLYAHWSPEAIKELAIQKEIEIIEKDI